MGNHSVGHGMAAAAKVFWLVNGDAKVTKEKALAALDAAGEDYVGADAEFDDELHEWTNLSRLVAIAFDATENGILFLKGELPDLRDGEQDDAADAWYDGPYTRFRNHFQFC